jgi:hypothetical protein
MKRRSEWDSFNELRNILNKPCRNSPLGVSIAVIDTAEILTAVKTKSKLSHDRQSVGQSVLVSGHNPGPWSAFLLFEIFLRQLLVYFVAPSLPRGRVCTLLLLLGLTSAVALVSESRGTQDHILLSQVLRFPQPGGPGPRIYILQGQGGPVIPPGIGSPFCRLLRLIGLWWRYSNPSSHRHYSWMMRFQIFLLRLKIRFWLSGLKYRVGRWLWESLCLYPQGRGWRGCQSCRKHPPIPY